MIRIVINGAAGYGGFGLSMQALIYLGVDFSDENLQQSKQICEAMDLPRDDNRLVRCVEYLGEAANGHSSRLKVVEIPSGVEWEICECDGVEWVAEKHRKWK